MANFIEKLGLGFMTESEESISNLMMFVAQEGKPIMGYYGYPYINHHMGDIQLILRTVINHEKESLEIVGFDTHASGNCVWDVVLSEINLNPKDSDVLQRRCVVSRKEDGAGMAIVNVVNADVLPLFKEGVEVKLQMIAFPHEIEYFRNEDEYAETQPDWNGGKLLLADGSVFPIGVMNNRSPESDNFESDDDLDELMQIRGTVKALYNGVIEFGEQKHDAYIRCIIDTQFGELEIVHTFDDVDEAQQENICVGATVSGIFTLSGDAAIYEYENGMVKDEKNTISILRDSLSQGDAERLRYALAEDATYFSGYNKTLYRGPDEIIERFNYVTNVQKEKAFTYMGSIVSVDDGDEELPFGPGTRCIVIANKERNNYQNLAFFDINENGEITSIITSDNSRYHFSVED